MTKATTYHEAPTRFLDEKEKLVSAMDSMMSDPVAVSSAAAYDVVSGEPVGTEGAYGESIDSVLSGGVSWTLTDYHNFKEHGVIIDGRESFERSLDSLLGTA